MDNKTKTDILHDRLPKNFKTRQNPNWTAILKAIGEADQNVADLLEEVRKQFCIKTASRPYLDKLGANVSLTRPYLMGMADPNFKQFVPVMSYQPKQVKAVIDQLLDVFFFKESTSAFTETIAYQPYYIKDEWELTYIIDSIYSESIKFTTTDFTDSTAVTAEEIVSAINRQAIHSFAAVFHNPIAKTHSVRIFTNAIGSKGSVQITGGCSNISLQFLGYLVEAGNGGSTTWTISRIGDEVTFTYTGGDLPRLELVQIGDIVMLDMPGLVSPSMPVNVGSFGVTSIDIVNNTFTFVDSFGAIGNYDHSLVSHSYVKFFTPEKAVIYTKSLRALSWEVKPGEIIVEIPASPPLARGLVGGSHVNGLVSEVEDRPSTTELTLDDASDWPEIGGKFVLQQKQEIQSYIKTSIEDTTTTLPFNTRFDKHQAYQYTGKTGNILTGITPSLPALAAVHSIPIDNANRNENNIVTINTTVPHGFETGNNIRIIDTVGEPVPVVLPPYWHDPSVHFDNLPQLIQYGDKIAAIGDFTTVGDVVCVGAASFDGNTWSAIDNNWTRYFDNNPSNEDFQTYIDSQAVIGDTVYSSWRRPLVMDTANWSRLATSTSSIQKWTGTKWELILQEPSVEHNMGNNNYSWSATPCGQLAAIGTDLWIGGWGGLWKLDTLTNEWWQHPNIISTATGLDNIPFKPFYYQGPNYYSGEKPYYLCANGTDLYMVIGYQVIRINTTNPETLIAMGPSWDAGNAPQGIFFIENEVYIWNFSNVHDMGFYRWNGMEWAIVDHPIQMVQVSSNNNKAVIINNAPNIYELSQYDGTTFTTLAMLGRYASYVYLNSSALYVIGTLDGSLESYNFIWYGSDPALPDNTTSLAVPINGYFSIRSVPSSTSFTYICLGDSGLALDGRAVTEYAGMSEKGSLAHLTTSQLDTGILGSHVWDTKAPFVLSSITAELDSYINAGDSLRTIGIQSPNAIPDEAGYLVLDLGGEQEEGPIRYISKPNNSLLEIDPTYVFKNDHAVGASIIVIRRRGAHILSGLGTEMSPYVADPVKVRAILRDLIEKVKSVGIFLEFIVRVPQQYYATLEVYGDGIDPG